MLRIQSIQNTNINTNPKVLAVNTITHFKQNHRNGPENKLNLWNQKLQRLQPKVQILGESARSESVFLLRPNLKSTCKKKKVYNLTVLTFFDVLNVVLMETYSRLGL